MSWFLSRRPPQERASIWSEVWHYAVKSSTCNLGLHGPCRHACLHMHPLPGWMPRAPTVINIQQLKKDTRLLLPRAPRLSALHQALHFHSSENLLTRISPGQASSSSDRAGCWRYSSLDGEDGEVSGRQGCLWPIPLASFFPQQIPSQRLSTLQGGFLRSKEEKVGRGLASSLLLPLWIASLFSRHYLLRHSVPIKNQQGLHFQQR